MILDRVRRAVFANWPIKLTALVLATVLWAAVAAEEPTTQLVPVTLVVTPPSGRALTQGVPQPKALYEGSTRELIKLYGSPPVIRKQIPDTLATSTFTLELSPADLAVNIEADVTARDVQPRTIVLRLDDFARRSVPVVPRVTVRPESGYAPLGGVTVTPGAVALGGPAAQVARIREVQTIVQELTGVAGPIAQLVPIDTTGFGVVRVSPRSVEVAIDVGPVSERVLMGVPVTLGGDRGNAWTVDPLAVIVTVRGPRQRLRLLTRDSIAVIALPSGQGDVETVRLDVIAPEGIAGSATPDSATLRRKRRG